MLQSTFFGVALLLSAASSVSLPAVPQNMEAAEQTSVNALSQISADIETYAQVSSMSQIEEGSSAAAAEHYNIMKT